jgi:hypothetical protein
MTRKYKLSDGSVVEVPLDPTQEELQWLHSQGAQPDLSFKDKALDVVNSALSGFNKGAMRAPLIAADLGNLAVAGINKLRPGTIDPEYEKPTSDRMFEVLNDKAGLEFHKPQTTAGRYTNSAAEGTGGLALGGAGAFKSAVSLSPPGLVTRMLGNPAVQSAGIGAAAELGGDMSRGFDETREQNPLMRFAGGASAALLAAIAGRLRTPTELKPLHDVTKAITPEQVQAAQAETARLQAAGARTNTIGDSFSQTNQLGALERDLSNKLGGEPLHAKLVSRAVEGGDIQRLLGEGKAIAQQTAVPGRVSSSGTNVVSGADQTIADLARRNRTAAMLPHLRNAPLLPEDQLSRVVAALQRRAQMPRNAGTEDAAFLSNAARTMEGLPRYPLPQPGAPGPIVGPGVLTGGPGAPPAPGGMPPPQLAAPRLQLPPPAGTALSVIPPTQGQLAAPGMPAIPAGQAQSHLPGSGFTFPSNQPITDIAESIPQGVNLEALSKEVKRLATVGDSTPTGPAGTILHNAAAGGASRNASRLLAGLSPDYRAAMGAYRANSPQVNITQALADTKLTPMPNTLNSSSTQDMLRAQLATELRKINPQAATNTNEKFRAADRLSRNTAERGMEGIEGALRQPAAGVLVQPFKAVWNMLSNSSRLKANTNLSNLLANPTQENYMKLLEIAKTDPTVARAMREQGLVGAINSSTRTEGNE